LPAISKFAIRYFRFPVGQTVSELCQNPFSLAILAALTASSPRRCPKCRKGILGR
jgi:hypothetical protein